MPAPVDLTRLPIGAGVHDTLLVLEVERRASAGGGFTTLTLGNCHGRLCTAPFWADQQPRISGIERGALAEIVGEVGSYHGRRQLKVSAIRLLPPGGVDWRRLLPSVGNASRSWARLDGWREEIRGPRLRATLDLWYADDDFRRRYEQCPASPAGHHAALGGLLEHTCEVAAIGRAIAGVCGADADLVLAGALLHDIGKLEAYRWEGGFETTVTGTLLGHVALGMLMLERRIRRTDPMPCTDPELAILHHLIASHHGRQEFGAPVPPMTLEAEVLHFADNASARSASMAEALADPDNFEGQALVSARGLWQLDRRRAFRGGSNWGRPAQGGETERPPSRG